MAWLLARQSPPVWPLIMAALTAEFNANFEQGRHLMISLKPPIVIFALDEDISAFQKGGLTAFKTGSFGAFHLDLPSLSDI